MCCLLEVAIGIGALPLENLDGGAMSLDTHRSYSG